MVQTYDRLYIGGDWSRPHGQRTIEILSPTTEEVVGTVPEADEVDIDTAVTAARRAFDDPSGWANWDPSQRAEAMQRFATELDKRSDRLADLATEQMGMPTSLAKQSEAVAPSVLLRYYADLITRTPAEETRSSITGGTTLVRRLPIGVVAIIVPWNFPQTLTFAKLAAALAAGNTAVIKPAPQTVLDAHLVAEAAHAAGLPPGVVNTVPGGSDVGAYLVSHPGVDKVSFTGSATVGRAIGRICGELLRPVTLELGGKSATILLDDVDLAANMEQLFGCTLLNSGQTCYIGTRILAPRSRYQEVVDAFAALVTTIPVGDPFAPETAVGPLATRNQRDRVEGYIAKGREEARLVAGGGRPGGKDRGWFVEPTVFADVDNSHTIAREEIFGPVLSIIAFDNDEDAVRIANDSDYGLGGSVWTADHERGLAIAKRIQTGTVGVNGYGIDFANPYGGVKASGMGREFGPEGLSGFQQIQSVYLG
ncbi:aldehyde dehydrogenase [Nocardia sp. NPDC004711]